MALLELRDIHKTYHLGGETIRALDGVSLDIDSGEFISIIGPSGSGKSTLMHILGCLDSPTSGTLRLDDTMIHDASSRQLASIRNKKIGFVFQFFNLLPDFTALENAMFPALIQNKPKSIAKERAEHLLCEVGMKDRMSHKPGELSGGESQRVALARGLMNQPDLLLADEPTGNLDTYASDQLIELIRKLNEEFNQTFVLVTHSQRVAGQLDRVLELVGGKLNPTEQSLVI